MFVCTQCGLCCKNIDKVPDLKDFDLGNGVCKYLNEYNLCTIYESRPDICNVEKMYELKFKDIMSREEYEFLNNEGCRILKDTQRNIL